MNTSIKIIVISNDEEQSISDQIDDMGAVSNHINPAKATIPKKIKVMASCFPKVKFPHPKYKL